MSRKLIVLYGFMGYAVGMVGLSLFMTYVGGWGLPRDINAAGTLALPAAVSINLVLLLLFGLQHSIMARRSFKGWLAKYLPPATERSSPPQSSHSNPPGTRTGIQNGHTSQLDLHQNRRRRHHRTWRRLPGTQIQLACRRIRYCGRSQQCYRSHSRA